MAKGHFTIQPMFSDPTRLGTSKVTAGNRVVLVKDVAKALDVSDGDVVAFYRKANGKVWLRKLQ